MHNEWREGVPSRSGRHRGVQNHVRLLSNHSCNAHTQRSKHAHHKPPLFVCAMCSDGPAGVPEPAEFARAVEDSSRPRFDAAATQTVVKSIIDALESVFTIQDVTRWSSFWKTFPDSVEDISDDRLHPVSVTCLPRCALRLSDDINLASHQVRCHTFMRC